MIVYTYPKELLTGILVFVADESENFKIGTYIKNGVVRVGFPKELYKAYEYIIPYDLFNQKPEYFQKRIIMDIIEKLNEIYNIYFWIFNSHICIY